MWREVLDWLAKESGLALHVSDLPQGTFTYRDPGSYTIAQAVDRLNMFLIPQGYAIVQADSLLSVISLDDPSGLQQLSAMAKFIPLEALEAQEPHQVVRCLLPLGEIPPEAAVEEISLLPLMTQPKVLQGSGQLLVTETASQVREMQAILQSLSQQSGEVEHVLRTLQLEHIGLRAFLDVARPHLGWEDGAMAGQSLSISAGESESQLFVSGTKEAVELLAELIEVVDTPEVVTEEHAVEQTLVSHPVQGDNLQAVYDVLVTLLADRSIRLSMEQESGSIVALAEEDVHQQIERTIEQMQGSQRQFEVIELQTVDPYFVIGLLDEMFDLAAEDEEDPKRTKIDGDPATRRLFIRGRKDEVAEIRTVVERLDSRQIGSGRRVVPLFGVDPQQVLEQSKALWLGNNPIRDRSDATQLRASITERVVAGDPASALQPPRPGVEPAGEPPFRMSGFVSTRNGDSTPSEAPPIGVNVTQQGIVIESQDVKALEQFENHVRRVAETEDASSVQTVVYYLKYSTADEATRLLADLLDGATALLDQQIGSQLVKSFVDSPNNGLMGSYLRSSDGAMVVSAGTLSVVSDSRLNRLICIGTQADLQLVEQYLEVLDRDQSLTDIQIHGSSHVIELVNTQATEMAEVVREAYGERVALDSDQRLQQEARQAAAREKSKGSNEPNLQTSSNQEPQMTLAIHERSNSLIVTAPDALFQEVERLVRELDEKGAETVEVVWYPQGEALEALREAVVPSESRSRDRRR